MLDGDGQGVLNDWDHCIHLDPNDPGSSRRTVSMISHRIHTFIKLIFMLQGTWQFLSVGLTWDPDKTHELMDDLEACFWVLLWQSIHFFDCNADSDHLDLFDEYRDNERTGERTGGRGKFCYLTIGASRNPMRQVAASASEDLAYC